MNPRSTYAMSHQIPLLAPDLRKKHNLVQDHLKPHASMNSTHAVQLFHHSIQHSILIHNHYCNLMRDIVLLIVHRNRPLIISLHQQRPPRTVHQQQPAMLLYLRKFLPSSFRRDEAPPLQTTSLVIP
ncbi:hypothetical protein K503DRAFT_31749 [Rhizopogon vinicolor AM-OR11-026]|uniref:Uncharacterized protein n=1 Tax=Rhizopogon vinicolor AM-OR11-026 TaxID=1314800 RepID=A0A1B7MH77_9AGAM|nr:hypothetical protein K503DRAFT_31749 [Rhizopogon vinicolor AM-OR11-026]